MSALKPCPFCGGAAEIIEADEAGDMAYVVQCQTRGCEASSAVVFAIKEPADDPLAERWNRRNASIDAPGVYPEIRNALRLALAFAEAEVENRESAGGDMSDYINEAQDVVDTCRAALIAAT